jgi:hypothetical protein
MKNAFKTLTFVTLSTLILVNAANAQSSIQVPLLTDGSNPQPVQTLLPNIPLFFSFTRIADADRFIKLTGKIDKQLEAKGFPETVQRFSGDLNSYTGICFTGTAKKASEIVELLGDSVLSDQFVIQSQTIQPDPTAPGKEKLEIIWDTSDDGDQWRTTVLKECAI